MKKILLAILLILPAISNADDKQNTSAINGIGCKSKSVIKDIVLMLDMNNECESVRGKKYALCEDFITESNKKIQQNNCIDMHGDFLIKAQDFASGRKLGTQYKISKIKYNQDLYWVFSQ